ncbi:MAG: Rpn family recombination-promoting nuclease/putative transposase [Tannerella sp.]|jgi:predicted transposase/invertase (TIGR01784 family)|nr:Rpn family recombination-promoting nuclease/putative transposase [Tannerella sp.]
MAKKKDTATETKAPSVFMNPLTDFGFKKIFGDRELMINFLNDMIPNARIKEIQYRPTEQMEWESRKAVYDLLCTNEADEYFIVEIQRAKQTFFADRALFYSSCMIRKQAPSGKKWNFELKAVYVVAILNFNLSETDSDHQIFERISLMNERTMEPFSDKLRFIYIQLKNFTKTPEELESPVDYWLYSLRHLEKLDDKPLAVQGRIFERLFHIARIDKLNSEEMETYNRSVLEYDDVMDAVQYATISGEKRGERRGERRGEKRGEMRGIVIGKDLGINIGRDLGIAIGKDLGIGIGEKQGEYKNAIKFAYKLNTKGTPIAEISELTELSLEELKNILGEC